MSCQGGQEQTAAGGSRDTGDEKQSAAAVSSHGEVGKFVCLKCGQRFIFSKDLIPHTRAHSVKKNYGCGDCGKLFKKKWQLISHTRVHSNEKNLVCSECGKRFLRIYDLNRHILSIHIGEKNYECGECGMRYARGNDLTRHRRTHTGELYACSECDKGFTKKSNLARHERMHTRERTFECGECGKRLSRSSYIISYLEHYMCTHTAEKDKKKYECKCGKGYTRRSHFNKHMERTHMFERNFECGECLKGFT